MMAVDQAGNVFLPAAGGGSGPEMPESPAKSRLNRLLARLRRGREAVESGDAEALLQAGAPTFLLLGSLSGTSHKDAESYARGQADQLLTSVEMGRVFIYEDKAHERMVYEIHEGGAGFSIAEKVVQALDRNEPVKLALANDAHVSIEQNHDQIFSLIFHPAVDGLLPGLQEKAVVEGIRPVTDFVSLHKLQALYPDHNRLSSLGGALLAISFVVLLLSGGFFMLTKSGLAQADAFFALAQKGVVADAEDNPAWQLNRAKLAASPEGKSLAALRKTAAGWSWEFKGGSGAPAAPAAAAPAPATAPVAPVSAPVGAAAQPPVPAPAPASKQEGQ